MTAVGFSPAVTRIQPGAIVLFVLACAFAAAAGYGWLGESRDHADYLGVYESLARHDTLSGYRYERGYMYLSWLCKFYAGMDFAQFYTFLAGVSLLLKFRLLWKHTSAPVVAALVYLMVLFPLHEYTQLRAAVALAFAYTGVDEYLDGRRIAALLLFVAAALFHTTAIVVGAGAALVILVARRTPVFAAAFFSAIAFGASLLVSASIRILKATNPLAGKYVKAAFLDQPPNVFSGENLLLFTLIVGSAILLRPWQTRRDGVFYYLSFWVLIAYVALLKVPVFAHRLSEAFIFSCFLFAFRFDDTHRSRIPSLILILTGGWMVYEAISTGLLFVTVR